MGPGRLRAVLRTLTGGLLAGGLAVGVAACGTTTGGGTASTASSAGSSGGGQMKVAFLYNSPVNDQGWDTAMYQGQQAAAAKYGSKVSITMKLVPDGPQVKTVLQSLISAGYKFIVCTSYAEQTYSIPLAKANPDVKFIQVESAKTLPNLATYFTQDTAGWYLAGMAAAESSKTATLGMVGGFPISDLLAETNAWALGAQSVKPAEKVRVTWTDNWDSVSLAQNAASGLVNAGAGALAFLTTGPAPATIAQRSNIPWIGYQVDQRSAAPAQYLGGVVWNMVPYFTTQIGAALAGTWKTGTYYVVMTNGSVSFDKGGSLYGKLPSSLQAQIAAKQAAFTSGAKNPFTGPMYDQAGKLVVPAGKTLDGAQLALMGYLVKGVIGTVPKGA
ncbi:MAG TPA: BMP family ABC transporter substrate-binding protein [Solirubrobacteraceae bacterium]|nr:BMP family ABC transporter substrate-binding protein [Solirubrobacteraceae bacterium]